jgi:hypothetical protein
MALRESTFITPREGDEDVFKKAHVFIGKFRCPPFQVFKIFNAPL